MGIKGIDHWVIVAADLQRTLDFYQRLGLPIAWEKRPGRPDMATPRSSRCLGVPPPSDSRMPNDFQ